MPKELTKDEISELKKLKERVSQCPVEAAMKIQELQQLLSSHEPHGRNYTNGQYVQLRERVQELETKNESYEKLLRKIENNMGITDEENEMLLSEIEEELSDIVQQKLF